MRNSPWQTVGLAVVMALCCGAVCQAAPVTYHFEAISTFDEAPFREIGEGVLIRGGFTFESTAERSPHLTGRGLYDHAVTAFWVDLEGIGSGHNTGPGSILVDRSSPLTSTSTELVDEFTV